MVEGIEELRAKYQSGILVNSSNPSSLLQSGIKIKLAWPKKNAVARIPLARPVANYRGRTEGGQLLSISFEGGIREPDSQAGSRGNPRFSGCWRLRGDF